MDADRALAYVEQALGRLAEVQGTLAKWEPGTPPPAGLAGAFISLRANLESAKTDLTPDKMG